MEDKKIYKISFLSGKGGVGKSIICANLARFFIKKFDIVLIWDNNLNYPIQHFLNGIEPNVRLVDVLKSSISIEYAGNRGPNRLFFVGGSSAVPTDPEENYNLIDNFFALRRIPHHSSAYLLWTLSIFHYFLHCYRTHWTIRRVF